MKEDTGSGQAGAGTGEGNGEGEGEGIAGTPFKSVEELAKGWNEASRKIGEQGNELGVYKKQAETLTETLRTVAGTKATKSEETAPAAVDYAGQREAIEKEIAGLDPVADDYQKSLAKLIRKSNQLTAEEQHERTLNAASSVFKKELDERDSKSQRQAFYDANPTFNTPEMQARIRDYLAKDRTGMSDPLVAFREIQRDDADSEAQRIAAENAELKKRLELAEGKNNTGKVITKGQSPGQVTKPAKVTGAALDEGMRAALAASQS